MTEIARSRVELDGQQAQAELKELQDKARALRKELKEMRISRDPGLLEKQREFDLLNRRINAAKKSTFDLNNVLMNLSGASLKDLTRAQRALQASIRGTNRETVAGNQAFREKSLQLRRVQAEMAKVRAEMTGLNQQTSAFGRMAASFNKYFGILTTTIASLIGLLTAGRKTITAFAEFDDKVADVMKVTRLTRQQVYELNEEFKKMDTRSAQEELIDLAWVAGKLGIKGRENILGFVRAADQISVALKKDLGGNAEGAVREIGKLVDVFKVKDEFGIEQGILKVGSAINELGMASTAAEGFLVNFTKRAAGIAPSAGVSIANVLGLAATLDQLGQQAETSSTVYTMVMAGMHKKTEQFASVARMDLQEFIDLLNKDANEAMIRVLDGLQGNEGGMQDLVESLGEVGLEGRRSTAVLGVLANNTEILRKEQALANKAFEEGTSVTNEFNIKNNSALAILEKRRKNLGNLAKELGERLIPYLNFSIRGFSYFVKTLLAAPRIYQENKTLLTLMAGALLMLYSAKVKVMAITVLEHLALQRGIGLRIREAVVTRAATLAESYRAALIGKTTVLTRAAAIATVSWSNALKMLGGPVGLMIGAITAYIALMQQYGKNARENRRLEMEKNAALDEARKVYEDLNAIADQYKVTQEDINRLSLQQKLELRDEIYSKLELAQANLLVVQTKRAEIAADNARLSMWKVMTASFRLMFKSEEEAITGLEKLNKKAADEGNKAASELDLHISNILGSINELKTNYQLLINDLEAESIADTIGTGTIKQLEERLRLYNVALKNTEIGSADYHRVLMKVNETQLQLNEAIRRGSELLDQAVNSYEELTRSISDARKEMAGLVADGNYAAAQISHAAIRNLEAQKLVIDGIIESGGDVVAFLDSLSDAEESLLLETAGFNEKFLEDFSLVFDEIADQRKEAAELELERQKRQIEYQLEQEKRLADERIQLERDVARAKQEITDSLLDASFQMAGNYINADYNRQLSSLNNRRDAELKNENLSWEQRDEIREKYRLQENKIREQAFMRQQKADVIQSLINTSLAIGRALAAPPGWPLNAPSVATAGISGAAQTAVIAAQKVPQYFGGKYTVIGEKDNITYSDVPFTGWASTGIYHRPALVAERGPEIVVDAPTTRNIRLNYPEILQAIQAVRVPQYAAGKYESVKEIRQASLPVAPVSNEELVTVLRDLRTQLSKGIQGKWVLQDFTAILNEVDDLEELTRM